MSTHLVQILSVFLVVLQSDVLCQFHKYGQMYTEDTPLNTEDVISTVDSDYMQTLIAGQTVLNGYQAILNNIGHPDVLKTSVEDFVNELKSNNLDTHSIKNLGKMYIDAVQQRGYNIRNEDKRMMKTAFNLIANIFSKPLGNLDLSETDFERASMRRYNTNKDDLSFNVVYNKDNIDEIVKAIKEGLAKGTKVEGKNVNQNLNLNINILTMLDVGENLRKANII